MASFQYTAAIFSLHVLRKNFQRVVYVLTDIEKG